MQTVGSAFERELRTLMDERIVDLLRMLEVNAFDTVAEFRHVMGRISELRGMDALMDEARKRADQRER